MEKVLLDPLIDHNGSEKVLQILVRENSIGRQLQRARSTQIQDSAGFRKKVQDIPIRARDKSSSTLVKAFLVLTIYLAVGLLTFLNVENELHGTRTVRSVDALYFSIVTMTTVGYGDLVPSGILAKLLTCAYVFVGCGLVVLLLGEAANYLVEKQERLLQKAIDKHMHPDNSKPYLKDRRVHIKALISGMLVFMLFAMGMFFFIKFEQMDPVDAFYCVCVTITTLGYGDESFKTTKGRIFAVFWILLSTISLAQFFLHLAEIGTEERQKHLAQWILTREVTISDLDAADLDDDGAVSPSEFVLYKLKEMGRIEEEELTQILKQFYELDADRSGTLTPSDFLLIK